MVFEVNMGALTQQVNEANEAKKNRGDFSYLHVEQDKTTCFYLLPPWSARGALSRDIYKSFMVPVVGNSGKTRVGWQSFDIFEPGIGDKDPIRLAINDLSTVGGQAVKRMRAGRKAMVNVIHVGTIPLSPEGVRTGDLVPPETLGKISILDLPGSVYDELALKMLDPSINLICMPETAIMVFVTRTGKKIDTKYKTELAGTNDPITGFIPTRVNLHEQFPDLEENLTKLPDLDKIWPLPDDKERGVQQQVADAIRAKFSPPQEFAGMSTTATGEVVLGAPGTTPMPQAMPQGQPQAAAPVQTTVQPMAQPAAQTAAAPPPSWMQPPPATAQAAPAVATAAPVHQPVVQPAAQVGAPVQVQPVAEFPDRGQGVAHSSNVAAVAEVPPVATSPLGLQMLLETRVDAVEPPRGPEGDKPVCLYHKEEISKSPNAAWCEGCAFNIMCVKP